MSSAVRKLGIHVGLLFHLSLDIDQIFWLSSADSDDECRDIYNYLSQTNFLLESFFVQW